MSSRPSTAGEQAENPFCCGLLQVKNREVFKPLEFSPVALAQQKLVFAERQEKIIEFVRENIGQTFTRVHHEPTDVANWGSEYEFLIEVHTRDTKTAKANREEYEKHLDKGRVGRYEWCRFYGKKDGQWVEVFNDNHLAGDSIEAQYEQNFLKSQKSGLACLVHADGEVRFWCSQHPSVETYSHYFYLSEPVSSDASANSSTAASKAATAAPASTTPAAAHPPQPFPDSQMWPNHRRATGSDRECSKKCGPEPHKYAAANFRINLKTGQPYRTCATCQDRANWKPI
jgi:hypothetical protein